MDFDPSFYSTTIKQYAGIIIPAFFIILGISMIVFKYFKSGSWENIEGPFSMGTPIELSGNAAVIIGIALIIFGLILSSFLFLI